MEEKMQGVLSAEKQLEIVDIYKKHKENFKKTCKLYEVELSKHNATISGLKEELENVENFARSMNCEDTSSLFQKVRMQSIELGWEKAKNKENVEELEAIRNQLDLALWKAETTEPEKCDARKHLEVMKRENHRLKNQAKDLAMQVRSLLMETEHLRGNHYQCPTDVVDEPQAQYHSNGQQYVTDHLVTFKNIEELQRQNERLLEFVRDFVENPEEADALKGNEKADKDRMQLDVTNAINDDDDDDTTHLEYGETETKFLESDRNFECLQAAYKALEEKFEIYKREKNENERIQQDAMTKIENELSLAYEKRNSSGIEINRLEDENINMKETISTLQTEKKILSFVQREQNSQQNLLKPKEAVKMATPHDLVEMQLKNEIQEYELKFKQLCAELESLESQIKSRSSANRNSEMHEREKPPVTPRITRDPETDPWLLFLAQEESRSGTSNNTTQMVTSSGTSASNLHGLKRSESNPYSSNGITRESSNKRLGENLDDTMEDDKDEIKESYGKRAKTMVGCSDEQAKIIFQRKGNGEVDKN